jgi:hypothetical protein
VQQPRYRPAQTLPHGDAALQQEGANLIDDAGMNRPHRQTTAAIAAPVGVNFHVISAAGRCGAGIGTSSNSPPR